MIVDFHTHTFPDAIAADTVRKLAQASRTVPFTDGTAGALAASMERAGVDLSIILPVATKARQVPGINERAAALNAQSGPLFSFGAIHPDCEDWRQQLDRAAALGLKGVKIHPVYQGVPQDDPRYLRILEHAGALGLIVVTHGGVDIGYPGHDECAPDRIRRAVRQAGPVTLVAAHMGGWKQWNEALEQLCDTQVYLDISFSTGRLTPLREDSYAPAELELLGPERFTALVRAFGADRVLFGTDSPWSGHRESIAWLDACPLTAAEKAAILGENARNLLKL